MDRFSKATTARSIGRRQLLKAAAVSGAGAAFASGMRPASASAQERSGPVQPSVMRAIYDEVKTPHKYGIVLQPETGTLVDSPSIFRWNDAWYMVYIVFHESDLDVPNKGYETLVATSPDLLTWTPLGTILPFRDGAWDATQAAGYAALQNPAWNGSKTLQRHAGKYWLSYLGGDDVGYEAGDLSIGVAFTDDPTSARPWTRPGAPVLGPHDADARWWERGKLYKSNVILDPQSRLGAPYVMYYNATTDGVERIGMAVSHDMLRWRRYGTDPVIDNGAGISGDPQVVRIGDVWVMFYFGAFWRPGAFDTFACSYDLVTWTKWTGPDLVAPSEPYDTPYAHKPWVIKHDGVVYHFYTAVGDRGRAIAVACSEDLGESPLNRPEIAASASYTYVQDNPAHAVDGVISYDDSPRNRWTAYQSPHPEDWLRLDLRDARDLTGLRLHVYDDGGGVRPPAHYDVQVLRDGAWVSVANQTKSPAAPGPGLNTVTFDAVPTSSIRVLFSHVGDGGYSGVTEVELVGWP